jgi:hypothetical protein
MIRVSLTITSRGLLIFTAYLTSQSRLRGVKGYTLIHLDMPPDLAGGQR